LGYIGQMMTAVDPTTRFVLQKKQNGVLTSVSALLFNVENKNTIQIDGWGVLRGTSDR